MKAPAMFFVLAAFSALVVAAQQPTSPVEIPQGPHVLEATGDGVQIYTCTKAPTNEFKWTLTGPKAKLLDKSKKKIGSHFVGPTWKVRGGQVQGQNAKALPDHQASAEAIAWLVIEAKPGTATGSLANVAQITRTETQGGVAPLEGCQSARNVGKKKSVHYTATYTFYAAK